MRRLMDAFRAINENGVCHVVHCGCWPGPICRRDGALDSYNRRSVRKLFAEAVEAIDPRPVEGVRATGANALEEILYRRHSASLARFGFRIDCTALNPTFAPPPSSAWWAQVGFGVVLHESIRGFDYAETSAILLIIIVSVTLIDVIPRAYGAGDV
jgi:phosphonate transport system permease protein